VLLAAIGNASFALPMKMDAAVVPGKHLVGLVGRFAVHVSFSRCFLCRGLPWRLAITYSDTCENGAEAHLNPSPSEITALASAAIWCPWCHL